MSDAFAKNLPNGSISNIKTYDIVLSETERAKVTTFGKNVTFDYQLWSPEFQKYLSQDILLLKALSSAKYNELLTKLKHTVITSVIEALDESI